MFALEWEICGISSIHCSTEASELGSLLTIFLETMGGLLSVQREFGLELAYSFGIVSVCHLLCDWHMVCMHDMAD